MQYAYWTISHKIKATRQWNLVSLKTITREIFSVVYIQLSFNVFRYPLNLAYNKNKLYVTLDYWSRDMLNFDFLKRVWKIVPPPYFEYDFSRKLFLMLYSINWPDFIIWLPLLLEILGNMSNTQTICRQKPTNCLSVFNHFVGLKVKWKTLKY